MVADPCRLNMGILFTNNKLPSIRSELVPRSRSKAIYAVKSKMSNCFVDKSPVAGALVGLGLYSPTILKNVHSLVLQNFFN